MGKRKQPEACSVDTNSKVVESEDTPPVEESPHNVIVTTESSPSVGGLAEGLLEDTVDDTPQPAATGERPGKGEQGTETFWYLLARVGYLVW